MRQAVTVRGGNSHSRKRRLYPTPRAQIRSGGYEGDRDDGRLRGVSLAGRVLLTPLLTPIHSLFTPTMAAANTFDGAQVLSYLALPQGYQPSPESAPVEFLRKHIRDLPPHLLALFSANTSPKQRTVVPEIRSRRLKYAQSNPPELALVDAKSSWPALWEGSERPGTDQGKAEKEWVDTEFLGGSVQQQVGKLGELLRDYEEERESERVRNVRRQRAEYIESLPEEDEESDEDEADLEPIPEPSPAENEEWFLRNVKERFIYGFLEVCLCRLPAQLP